MLLWLLLTLDPSPPLHLTILHTGDVYSMYDGTQAVFFNPEFPPPVGGLQALADLIETLQKDHPNLLLLDAGNFFAGDLSGNHARPNEAIAFLQRYPYTAINVGFRDIVLGPDRLRSIHKAIPTPLISSNLKQADGQVPDFVVTDTVIEVDGVPIGIFGLVSEYGRIYNLLEKMEPWQVEREIRAAQEAVNRLKQRGAKLILCLSNTGFAHEKRLAREVPEIDVIFGSVDPPGLREPWIGGPRHTILVRPYSGGTQAGVLEIWVDRNLGGVVSYRYRSIALIWEDFPGPASPSP